MADAIEANADVILAANAEDLHAAQDVISSVMLDRLRLTKDRIAAISFHALCCTGSFYIF